MAVIALCAAALAPWPVPAATAGSGSLGKLEKEFKGAIDKVTPATVVCVPDGATAVPPGSSGVIVSRKGLVLSDGDVGMATRKKGEGQERFRTDDVEIRVPDLKKGTYTSYKAKVIRRDRKLDATLLRIEDPPPLGFSNHLLPGSSAELKVGSFTFAMGNAFGLSAEGSPTLTAGVISSLTRLEGGTGYEFLYTSAAVNPGMNGGPLVDVNGRLVGTISTWGRAGDPKEPYQFLGKVIPIDRIRAAFKDLEEYEELFPDKAPPERRSPESDALERVFQFTARQGYAAVVSLDVKRKTPVSGLVPARGGTATLARYQGPVSGVLVSSDGLVITSLYNLTNIVELGFRRWSGRMPPEARVSTGLAAIESVQVHFSDGAGYPAKLVSYHEGLGLALLRADLSGAEGSTAAGRKPLATAPPDALRAGMFALALGNPFGATPNPDPLLTVGILSKKHADDDANPWRGHWQTDAGGTDANCGGAVVDVEGRLLGMMSLWAANYHGRNSGIAFILPWSRIAEALPAMKGGKSFRRPLMGITWDPDSDEPKLGKVTEGSAAAKAGLLTGDVLLKLGDDEVASVEDCTRILQDHWAGDRLKISARRGDKAYEFDLVLGARE